MAGEKNHKTASVANHFQPVRKKYNNDNNDTDNTNDNSTQIIKTSQEIQLKDSYINRSKIEEKKTETMKSLKNLQATYRDR